MTYGPPLRLKGERTWLHHFQSRHFHAEKHIDINARTRSSWRCRHLLDWSLSPRPHLDRAAGKTWPAAATAAAVSLQSPTRRRRHYDDDSLVGLFVQPRCWRSPLDDDICRSTKRCSGLPPPYVVWRTPIGCLSNFTGTRRRIWHQSLYWPYLAVKCMPLSLW